MRRRPAAQACPCCEARSSCCLRLHMSSSKPLQTPEHAASAGTLSMPAGAAVRPSKNPQNPTPSFVPASVPPPSAHCTLPGPFPFPCPVPCEYQGLPSGETAPHFISHPDCLCAFVPSAPISCHFIVPLLQLSHLTGKTQQQRPTAAETSGIHRVVGMHAAQRSCCFACCLVASC